MNIEITDACNLRCPGCHRPTESATFMSVSTFRFIARKLRAYGWEQAALFWRGEPCLHPNLPEIAGVSKELGFKKVWTSTNTAVPNLHDVNYVSKLLSHLDRIVACVDGYDQATLSLYRVGASWDMTLKNLKTIADVKTDCVREMKVLMFKYNDGHEDFYRKLARQHNFDHITFTSPIIGGVIASSADIETWMSTNPKFQRYRELGDDIWKILRKEKCMARPIVSVHGDLHPCCIDWDLSYPMGSVVMEKVHPIMTGAYRKLKLRLSLMGFRMCKDWCNNPLERVSYREDV